MQQANRDQWTLGFFKDKNGGIKGSLLVDIDVKPDGHLPWLVYLTFPFKGRPLPTSPELDAFEKLDKQIRMLSQKHRANNVAIVMLNGVRDWIVYAHDAEVIKKVATREFSKSGVKIEVLSDPNWNQYRDLRETAIKTTAKPGPPGTVHR